MLVCLLCFSSSVECGTAFISIFVILLILILSRRPTLNWFPILPLLSPALKVFFLAHHLPFCRPGFLSTFSSSASEVRAVRLSILTRSRIIAMLTNKCIIVLYCIVLSVYRYYDACCSELTVSFWLCLQRWRYNRDCSIHFEFAYEILQNYKKILLTKYCTPTRGCRPKKMYPHRGV